MQTPYNYSAPDWAPLETTVAAAGLPLATCAEFMWMSEQSRGIHSYKHSLTRRYVHIDSTRPSASIVDLRASRT